MYVEPAVELGSIGNGGEFEASHQHPVTTEMVQFVVDGAGTDQLLHPCQQLASRTLNLVRKRQATTAWVLLDL